VESFVKIHTGELPPLKAYTEGKARFSASQKLIMEVGKIFPLGKK
jgi:hypothetical protein